MFFLIILECIWNCLYCLPIIDGENISNSNIKCSQLHNLFQIVIKKVSSNKHFVKSNLLKNLLRNNLHDSNSIPKLFIRNNVCQHM